MYVDIYDCWTEIGGMVIGNNALKDLARELLKKLGSGNLRDCFLIEERANSGKLLFTYDVRFDVKDAHLLVEGYLEGVEYSGPESGEFDLFEFVEACAKNGLL